MRGKWTEFFKAMMETIAVGATAWISWQRRPTRCSWVAGTSPAMTNEEM